MGAEHTLLYGPDDHPQEEKKPGKPVRCRLVSSDGAEMVIEMDRSVLTFDAITLNDITYLYRCTSDSKESQGNYDRVYRQLRSVTVKIANIVKNRG